ncbi:hypothetical protein Tco_1450724, partial [Tanacetum coccineum]
MFNERSIAMVGRATEVASLLNQGNGLDVSSSCNLYDRRHLHVLELKNHRPRFKIPASVLMPIARILANSASP